MTSLFFFLIGKCQKSRTHATLRVIDTTTVGVLIQLPSGKRHRVGCAGAGFRRVREWGFAVPVCAVTRRASLEASRTRFWVPLSVGDFSMALTRRLRWCQRSGTWRAWDDDLQSILAYGRFIAFQIVAFWNIVDLINAILKKNMELYVWHRHFQVLFMPHIFIYTYIFV